MTAWMPPPVNPRKRPAPGASPIPNLQMQNQAFPAQPQVANDPYMRWNQGAVDNTMYPDLNYNMAGYGANNVSAAQYQPNLPAASTQLARRPLNRQLVQTGPRTQYDNSNEWSLAEDGMFDPNSQNGGLAENDSIERLEERAQIAKRDAQSKRKQIPPFVQKLNSFLDDGKNTELIRWSDRGDSFVVLDEDEFAKTLIPELFKHNNYASFVRQLNMYGFHKRVGLSDNSMKASERKNKSPSEYSNPYFKRGHPNLLWLINKPKNPQKKGKGGRTKQEEGADESDEDNRDGLEETYGYGQDQHIGRALSAAPEAGQPGPVALTLVQKQLRDIQQQQNNISNMIARLRKEHNDLYSQAVAFQTLHDRHESSINAILTFLATVYNRSLDGQGGGNIAQMFANAIPQDQHNVVDLGNINAQGAGNLSPMRRQQRLLMAPPNAHQPGSISPASSSSHGAPPPAPSSSGSNYARATTTGTSPRSGAIEELFEVSPGHSPQSQQGLKREHHASLAGTPPSATTGSPSVDPDAAARGPAQQNIMELINTTNARVPRHRDMAFPDVLHHYENANGASPLTHQQRADMLHLIASSSAGAAAGPGGGGMGALVDQHAHHPQPQPQQHGQQQQQQHAPPPQQPPPMLPLSPGGGLSLGHSPSLAQLGYTQAEIEELVRMQREQDSKISEVSSLLGPLTPGGGGIPGGGGYFGDGGAGDGAGGNNLDLDQFLDAGAYYNDDDGGAAAAAAAGAGGGFGAYDGFVDQTMGGGLDFGMDAVGVGPGVGSPMEMGEGEGEEVGREGSPKRRRKG